MVNDGLQYNWIPPLSVMIVGWAISMSNYWQVHAISSPTTLRESPCFKPLTVLANLAPVGKEMYRRNRMFLLLHKLLCLGAITGRCMPSIAPPHCGNPLASKPLTVLANLAPVGKEMYRRNRMSLIAAQTSLTNTQRVAFPIPNSVEIVRYSAGVANHHKTAASLLL